MQYLDSLSEEEILKLNIPTGVPLVYELDADLKPIKHYYLGDQEAIAAAINSVANQGKKQWAVNSERWTVSRLSLIYPLHRLYLNEKSHKEISLCDFSNNIIHWSLTIDH